MGRQRPRHHRGRRYGGRRAGHRPYVARVRGDGRTRRRDRPGAVGPVPGL